jgi:hypothetical protein
MEDKGQRQSPAFGLVKKPGKLFFRKENIMETEIAVCFFPGKAEIVNGNLGKKSLCQKIEGVYGRIFPGDKDNGVFRNRGGQGQFQGIQNLGIGKKVKIVKNKHVAFPA